MVIITDDLKKAVTELYFYEITHTAGGFNTQLFDLIKKADSSNLKKIALGFPNEVLAIKMWSEEGDYGNELFRKCGLM